jgi:serine phosphatase RsbU (regulator of sigma subunit)
MNKWRLFHLKNEMLAANFLANFIGAVLVQSLIVKTEITFPDSLFDYLGVGKHNQGNIKVVVGDVSDHGIPSALLMTTARAFLKQRALRPGKLNQPGQIILIGTDGIWESQNDRRQMFGKKRFRDLIRTHAREPAKDILQAVITGLDKFRYPLEKEDDVTLVVIKVEP